MCTIVHGTPLVVDIVDNVAPLCAVLHSSMRARYEHAPTPPAAHAPVRTPTSASLPIDADRALMSLLSMLSSEASRAL